MPTQNLDELIHKLTELYRQRFAAEYKRGSILDRQGQPVAGHQDEERALREKVKAQDGEIRKKLEEWAKEQPARPTEQVSTASAKPPVFEATVETGLDVIKGSFSVDTIPKSGRVNVPLGQVYVFGRESMDSEGLPEVYLGGEVVLTKHKDAKSLVAVLAEAPGEVRCVANQWLSGISVSKEEVAKVSIKFPVRLHEPIKTLKRSGGAWMSPDGRKNINAEIRKQVEHRLQEVLAEPIQLWSSDKREALDKIQTMVDQDLRDWGLRVQADSISLVRQFPKKLYEMVMQFVKAEQVILDAIAAGEKPDILKQTGLSSDDLMAIEAVAEQKDKGSGTGLFLVLRERVTGLREKPELREKVITWLMIHGGASVADFIKELYFSAQPETAVKLSEQVLLFAFRNPVLGLGEWLDITASLVHENIGFRSQLLSTLRT